MKKSLVILALAALAACNDEAASSGPQPAAVATVAGTNAPAAPKDTAHTSNITTVVDVAVGSPDHTTLVAALKAGNLVESLASPGGVYTVFAPTNAAFDKLPKGTVEDLLKPENKEALRKVLMHHAAVPILQIADMHDGQTLSMSDGTKVTFHVKGGKVMVDNANLVASIPAANGVVHVVDEVILPPQK